MSGLTTKRIFVAGHRGMVGSAIVRKLKQLPAAQIVTRDRTTLDLCDQEQVNSFFAENPVDAVVFAAARVGGIYANETFPAEFVYENLAMTTNAIHAAYQHGVERFLFLGSTCIYPRLATQPMREEALLSGPLEKTNEAYAVAKIAGLKMCQFYRQQYGVTYHSAMPTNLYGPGDNYHDKNSHVLPALIRRFHDAKLNGLPEVTIWGTGKPRRELLHVDDLAAAIVHLLQIEDPPDWVNVGTGVDTTIAELAQIVADVVGFEGKITNDPSKPDGTPRKCTDSSLLSSSGWKPEIELIPGIRETYGCYLKELDAQSLRAV